MHQKSPAWVLQRPSKALIEAYNAIPKKKRPRNDVILRLDPEQGPFTQVEQDALHQWAHEQFCHGNLDPERYLYLRLAMIYGQRGSQLRMMVFDDFIKTDRGYLIRRDRKPKHTLHLPQPRSYRSTGDMKLRLRALLQRFLMPIGVKRLGTYHSFVVN